MIAALMNGDLDQAIAGRDAIAGLCRPALAPAA